MAMIAEMNPAPGMNIDSSFGMAFFVTVSTTRLVIAPITMSFRLASCSLILSHAAAGPSRTSVTTMSNPVSSVLTVVSFVALTSFARMFAQLMPNTENANFAISVSANDFGM
jgi:hypothetical protein